MILELHLEALVTGFMAQLRVPGHGDVQGLGIEVFCRGRGV